MAEVIATTKRPVRVKRVVAEGSEEGEETSPAKTSFSPALTNIFSQLIEKLAQTQKEYENLLKEIAEVKINWIKEQKDYESEILSRSQQEELARKREQETYTYETKRQRQIAEDEFSDRKNSWERSLKEAQDILAKEKTELESLRKLSANFEMEKEKAVKEAQVLLQKQLNDQYLNERKLREQEVKAEKDLLNLRIANLTAENQRQTLEIEILKKALEEAQRQVKEIAVRVIESGSAKSFSQPDTFPVK